MLSLFLTQCLYWSVVGRINMTEKWVVLYCSEEESYCLVTSTDVIFDEKLTLKEKYSFYYSGCSKMLTGTLEAIGGNLSRVVLHYLLTGRS